MNTALLKELGATEDTTLRQVKALAQQKVQELDRVIAVAQEKRQVFFSLLQLWNATDKADLPVAKLEAEVNVTKQSDFVGEATAVKTAKAKRGTQSAATSTQSKSKKSSTVSTKPTKTKTTQSKSSEKPQLALFDFSALLPKFAGITANEAFAQILESDPESEFSVGDIVKEAYGDRLQNSSFMRVCQLVGREMMRGVEQGLWVKSSQKPPRYASKLD